MHCIVKCKRINQFSTNFPIKENFPTDWNFYHPWSERLTSLGIMRARSKIPLNPSGPYCRDEYTQRNLSKILTNLTEIRLYYNFPIDLEPNRRLFGSWSSVWFQINRKMVNTIWFRFDLIRFLKYFSECAYLRIINNLPLPEFLLCIRWPLGIRGARSRSPENTEQWYWII